MYSPNPFPLLKFYFPHEAITLCQVNFRTCFGIVLRQGLTLYSRVTCFPNEVQACLELMPQTYKCWDYKCASPPSLWCYTMNNFSHFINLFIDFSTISLYNFNTEHIYKESTCIYTYIYTFDILIFSKILASLCLRKENCVLLFSKDDSNKCKSCTKISQWNMK